MQVHRHPASFLFCGFRKPVVLKGCHSLLVIHPAVNFETAPFVIHLVHWSGLSLTPGRLAFKFFFKLAIFKGLQSHVLKLLHFWGPSASLALCGTEAGCQAVYCTVTNRRLAFGAWAGPGSASWQLPVTCLTSIFPNQGYSYFFSSAKMMTSFGHMLNFIISTSVLSSMLSFLHITPWNFCLQK